ncbi:fimbrial protein [Rosenbergiella nectarea]|uniref:fimbrial protein n=1 Tax=Rosenbergiella nectarea TaxID=988801 RepID=UPI001F4DA7F5|nr:fimbrial protein [Rosenbergiella nectarea]
MKISFLGILGVALLFSPVSLMAAPNIVDGSGSVLEFQGKIVESSCTVDFSNQDFTVTLDRIGTHQFPAAGDEVAPVDFTVSLGTCASRTKNRVSVIFQGDRDRQNNQILAIHQQSDAARGVGIAIYDLQNNLIPIDRPYLLFTTNDNIFENTEKFIVRYKSTALHVTPGRINAEAKLLFIYQ